MRLRKAFFAPVLVLALAVANGAERAPEQWVTVLQDDFDGGAIDRTKWVLFPPEAPPPSFDPRDGGLAVHFRSERGDKGMATAVKPAPPYRLSFEFFQPAAEAGGYRLVVFHSWGWQNSWWFEFDRGAFAVWTTHEGGWAPRHIADGLQADTWYRVLVEDEPDRVRLTITAMDGQTVADSKWLPHDELLEPGSINFVAATGGGLRGAVFDNVRLDVAEGARVHRVATAVDKALHAALDAARPLPDRGRITVRTKDGLEIALDANAAPLETKLGRTVISPKDAAAYGGFYAWDISQDPRYVRFQGAERARADGTLKLKCEELGLRLQARLVSTGDRIDVRAELADERGQDRAIVLVWVMPLQAKGWWWGDSLNEHRQISEPGRYANSLVLGAGGRHGRHLVAAYPWVSLSTQESGLMLARPLDCPRLMTWMYDYTPRRSFLTVRVELGLSPETRKFPSRASFCFALSRLPQPEWGMRAAADRYYQMYPEFFVKRAEREGLWHLWVSTEIPNPEELGLVFHEQEPYYEDRVAFDDAHGGYSFTYAEPCALWQRASHFDEKGNFDAKAFLATAMERALQPPTVTTDYPFWSQPKPLPDAEIAQALLNSYIGRNGEPTSYWPAPPDRVTVNCNGDPELRRPNRASLWFDYEGVPALSDPRVDGAYLDSVGFSGFDAAENFRRDHWATADLPLVASFQAEAPCQLAGFAHYELYKAISDAMHSRGKLVLANTFPYAHLFVAHLLDVLGAGEAADLESFHRADKLSFCRALAYRKPVSHMNYAYLKKDVALEEKERAIQRNLIYCVWPGTGDGGDPTCFEPIRPLLRKYVPIFRALAEAGWEPIPLARAKPPQILVERYGSPTQGKIYLAIHNPSYKPTTATVTLGGLLAKALGRSRTILDIVTGARLPVEKEQVQVTLRPWQTMVLEITCTSQQR